MELVPPSQQVVRVRPLLVVLTVFVGMGLGLCRPTKGGKAPLLSLGFLCGSMCLPLGQERD